MKWIEIDEDRVINATHLLHAYCHDKEAERDEPYTLLFQLLDDVCLENSFAEEEERDSVFDELMDFLIDENENWLRI